MSILSIQSHVVYGYVGNKVAIYPLQKMGYDVWPLHTVQFSNHTGYKTWQGQIFSRDHIRSIVDGLEKIDVLRYCKAVLSGYMGGAEICFEIFDTVKRLKKKNHGVIYLCDPVIGNADCYIQPEVLAFFKKILLADIITPNQFEAESLSDIKISQENHMHQIAKYFHSRSVKIVIITGIELNPASSLLSNYISDGNNYLIINQKKITPSYFALNGTGDLFSTLFLGNYLKNFDPFSSFKQTIRHLKRIIHKTHMKQKRELEIIP